MSNKSKGRKSKAKVLKTTKAVETQPSFRIVPGMVVFNEADRILGWLSRHPFYKRIVVIDQGSTDGTLGILQMDPRVELYHSTRFEHFESPDYNALLELAKDDAMFVTHPDEFISAEMFREISKAVMETYHRFGVTSFYIARKNVVEGEVVNFFFKTAQDPNAKDWQLRFSLGVSIKFPNRTHSDSACLGKFAYLHDSVYITSENTLEQLAATIEKRRMQNHSNGRQRDLWYLKSVTKFIESKKEAADAKE